MKRLLCGMLSLVMLLCICAQLPVFGWAAEVTTESTTGETTGETVPQELTTSEDCIAILKKIEGFSKYPYWDNTQYTVGYGTRCPSDLYTYYKTNGITREEAEVLLRDMIADFEAALDKFIKKNNLTLSRNQYDALICFSFNCGTAWMNDSNGSMNRAVREGKTGSDFIYSMVLWSSAGGDYILQQRRLSEAYLYLEGVYEAYNDKSDGSIPSTYRYVYLDGNGGEVRFVIHGYDGAQAPGVTCEFTSTPRGYTFAGWATADGKAITVLDGSLPNGTVLYAQWADKDGKVVALPKGTVIDPVEVTVTASSGVNIRSGPGTYYKKVTSASKGATVTVTETYTSKNVLWGKCADGWLSLSYTNYGDATTDKPSGGDSPAAPTVASGDVNGDQSVNKDDAIYLLRHVLFPEKYEISTTGDTNGDKTTNKDDAIYLLRHVLFPDKYPLK